MLTLADAWWPLALATMAGLSTSIGAVIAVLQKPSARSMAALLGVALGVMATISCIELVARNALSGESDPLLVLAATMAGALTYYVLEPFFPKMDEQHDHAKKQDDQDDHEASFRSLEHQGHHGADAERGTQGAAQRKVATAGAGYFGGTSGGSGSGLVRKGSSEGLPAASSPQGGGGGGGWGDTTGAAAEGGGGGREGGAGGAHGGQGAGCSGSSSGTALSGEGLMALGAAGPGGGGGADAHCPGVSRGPKGGRMLRLGVLMAVTMTLHNLPEGFAVAFSAFTDFGPVMALAIALHNIPEGVIVAAPIFAATGSRWRAIGIATASGLSEPLGALLALLLLQPFFTQERLHYLLAFVGGVMLAVCGIELWPEGRNCRHDRAFAAGILGGSLVMAWTLYVEG